MSLPETRVEIPAEEEIERLKLEVATHKARADAAEKERDALIAIKESE